MGKEEEGCSEEERKVSRRRKDTNAETLKEEKNEGRVVWKIIVREDRDNKKYIYKR